MRKFVFVFSVLVFTMTSCMQESVVFTPDVVPGPINNLRSLIPSTAKDYAVQNDLAAKISTESGAQLNIGAMTFVNNSENVDATVLIDYVELESYADFILQEVDHESDLGFTNTMYSFYIGAKLNGNAVDVVEGGSIKVRIPAEHIDENIYVGKGDFESGKLKWNYNLSQVNSNYKFVSWEENKNGNIELKSGYEVTVNSTGWFTLVSEIKSNSLLEIPFCVDFPNNSDYRSDNTIAYVLLNDQKFISQAINMDGNQIVCTKDLPFLESSTFTFLSISHFPDSDEFHYDAVEFTLNQNQSVIDINPQKTSPEELKMILEDL